MNKGITTFAQGRAIGNIVKPIGTDKVTLKVFSGIPEIKESIIFVEEVEEEDEEASIVSMSVAVQDIELPEMETALNIVQAEELFSGLSGEDVEKELIESYGLSSDYQVTLGDEVGVGSEIKKLTTPGAHTNRESTLLEVRKAAKHTDEYYEGQKVKLTKNNRDLVEKLVQGESGAEGFIGAALVAQTIRDTMVETDVYDLMKIKRSHGYSGSLNTKPNKEVKDAVAFVFDNGGYIVQHKLIYFYSYRNTKSGFHESQKFIIEHGGHRFFDRID